MHCWSRHIRNQCLFEAKIRSSYQWVCSIQSKRISNFRESLNLYAKLKLTKKSNSANKYFVSSVLSSVELIMVISLCWQSGLFSYVTSWPRKLYSFTIVKINIFEKKNKWLKFSSCNRIRWQKLYKPNLIFLD